MFWTSYGRSWEAIPEMRLATLKLLAQDQRLTSDAVRLVIFIGSMGAGRHEIRRDTLRDILPAIGRDKARTALKLAVSVGWLEVIRPGWGKPNLYAVCDPSQRTGLSSTLSDPSQRTGLSSTLEGSVSILNSQDTEPKKPEETPSSVLAQGQDTDGEIGRSSVLAQGQYASSKKKGVGSRTPSVSPPDRQRDTNGLDQRALTKLTEGAFDGCRGALRDYLMDRVEPQAQLGYLMSVMTWFDGSPSAPKGFANLGRSKQGLLVASALNELLEMTPTNEKLMFRSSRGMVGSTATLRTKIEYHIGRRSRGKATNDAASAQGTLSFRDPTSKFPEER